MPADGIPSTAEQAEAYCEMLHNLEGIEEALANWRAEPSRDASILAACAAHRLAGRAVRAIIAGHL